MIFNSSAQVLTVLDGIYGKAIGGVFSGRKVLKAVSAEDLAETYIKKYGDPKIAAQKLVKKERLKIFGSGFITGLGGLVTLPIAIPSDLLAVFFVDIRMVAAVAVMGGYDVKDKQIKTFVYACLIGKGAHEMLSKMGVQLTQKISSRIVIRVPQKFLLQINKRVGVKLFTKAGEKSAIGLGKVVPIIGGLIGGGINGYSTNIVGKQAIKIFLSSPQPSPKGEGGNSVK